MLQVASVLSGCYICFTHMLQVYVLNVLYVYCIHVFHVVRKVRWRREWWWHDTDAREWGAVRRCLADGARWGPMVRARWGAGCVFRVGQTTSNRGGAGATTGWGVCAEREKNQQMGAGYAGVHTLAQPKIEKHFLYFKPTTSLLRITVLYIYASITHTDGA
jgi:hypothetical protein